MTHDQCRTHLGAAGPPCEGELTFLGSCFEVWGRAGGGERLVHLFAARCDRCDAVIFARPDETTRRYRCVPAASCTFPRPRRPRP
jgi:hypothetical protein